MKKNYFYLSFLFISFCLTLIYCTKGSEHEKSIKSQNISLQVAPTPTDPAVLKKVCIQQGGNPVQCTKQVWQCTFGGYTLQWNINTSFVYPLQGPTGSIVGAPIPTVVGADNYTADYSGGSPLPAFLITQLYIQSNCSSSVQSHINNYFNSVGPYEDSLIHNLNPKQVPTFGNIGESCYLVSPQSKTLGFKLVIYSLDANCNPTFAVTTIDWKPQHPIGCAL